MRHKMNKKQIKNHINTIKAFLFSAKSFFTFDGNVRFSPSSLSFFLLMSTIPTISIIAMILSFFNYEIIHLFDKINLSSLVSEELYYRLTIFFSSPPTSEKIPFIISLSTIAFLSSKGLYFFSYTYSKIIAPEKTIFFSLKKRIIFVFVSLFIELLIALFLIFLFFLDMRLTGINPFLLIILEYIVILIFLILIIAFIYGISQRKEARKMPILLGSIISSLLISIGTILYYFYLNHISKTLTYFGPLSNLFLFILIIYFISYLLLLGVQINKKWYTRYHNKTK